MVLYLVLCLISVLAGCGILTLIGVDVDLDTNLFLAPVITLCSLAILMGGLVAGGFSIGEITPAIFALCLAAAAFGAVRHGKTVLASWRSLLILGALPLLILLPAIVEGIENYSGGLCMDGWAYVTVGQSLQGYPLGSEGWLPLGVQYAARFGKETRFISFSFLALLAPLSGEHNDTQEVLGCYLGWLFFLYGSACLFFARAARLARPLDWMLVFLATLSGWTLKLINANSVDNTLAMCFLPAAIGVLVLIPRPSLRHGIVLGAILAAGLYAYPESWAFTIAAVLAIGAQKLIAAPHLFREYVRMGAAALITIVICILPNASQIATFFWGEVSAMGRAVGTRPGEGFYLLLSTPGYILTGYWGLTPDFPGQKYSGRYDVYANVTAYILTAAALVGLILLLRRRRWSLALFAVAMSAAYLTFLRYLHYPYAAYKVLVLTWFLIAYTVVITTEYIWQALGSSSRRSAHAAVGAGFGLLASVVFLFLIQERVFYKSLPFKSLREFRKVSAVENLAPHRPVAMIVDDSYANIWAVHFLRKTKLYLANQYRGYMVGNDTLLARSEPADPADIRYVVTDNERSFKAEWLLSKAGPYYVWDCGRGPWTLVTEIINPFGLENGAGTEPSFWIAKTYTEIQMLSRAAITAIVSAEFTFQGSSAEKPEQRVRVATGSGFETESSIGEGMHSIAVPLNSGVNRLLLRSVEKAPLLIRASHLSVSAMPVGDSAQISDIKNANGLERLEGDPFFWIGRSDTDVTISTSAGGIAELTATLLPGPSLVDKSKARLSIIPASGAKIEQDLGWGRGRISIPVRPGKNRIVMRAIGPSRTAAGDSRTMMIGIRDLKVSLDKQNFGDR